MTTALQVQTATVALPGWVGPTAAISLALMAASILAVLAGAVVSIRALGAQFAQISRNLAGLREELGVVLHGAQRMADEGEALVRLVREEGDAYLATSRRLRGRIDRGIDRASERMADLDALYEVVHEEVEETALRFATTLRTARLSTGIIARVLRRRRRR